MYNVAKRWHLCLQVYTNLLCFLTPSLSLLSPLSPLLSQQLLGVCWIHCLLVSVTPPPPTDLCLQPHHTRSHDLGPQVLGMYFAYCTATIPVMHQQCNSHLLLHLGIATYSMLNHLSQHPLHRGSPTHYLHSTHLPVEEVDRRNKQLITDDTQGTRSGVHVIVRISELKIAFFSVCKMRTQNFITQFLGVTHHGIN